MEVFVNGTEKELQNPPNLQEALLQLGYDLQGKGIAVAVNATVVPRDEWGSTAVKPGDKIEIVTARQGG